MRYTGTRPALRHEGAEASSDPRDLRFSVGYDRRKRHIVADCQ